MDFVEYLTFRCGMEVRLVLPPSHTFNNKHLTYWFEMTEDWHDAICRQCKESKHDTEGQT